MAGLDAACLMIDYQTDGLQYLLDALIAESRSEEEKVELEKTKLLLARYNGELDYHHDGQGIPYQLQYEMRRVQNCMYLKYKLANLEICEDGKVPTASTASGGILTCKLPLAIEYGPNPRSQ